MRRALTELYVHCVWTTWDRLPLINPSVEGNLYACIESKCREFGCEVLAIGGIADHIHLLVQFPATLEIAKLMKDVKGASSHLMTHELTPGIFFKWQGAYGAFTVGKANLPKLISYINNQKAHHQDNQLKDDWELQSSTNNEPNTLA